MKTTIAEIYVVAGLFLIVLNSEFIWFAVNKHVEPLLLPKGLFYLRVCLGLISIYNLGLILRAIIFVLVQHGFQRHLLPPVTVYLVGAMSVLPMGFALLVREILLKYFH